MEAFSLLKYWRGGGGGGSSVVLGSANPTLNSRATTIVTQNPIETDDDDDGEDDDDGPFFDLEFDVPDEEEEEQSSNRVNGDTESDEEEDDCQFNFTLNERIDQDVSVSPSDDLFFKGRLVPIEPSSSSSCSSVIIDASEPNSKPQFPVSFLKSATKFRVFMLGFKKSKLEKPVNDKPASEANNETAASSTSPNKQSQQQEDEKEEEATKQNRFFTVKFKVEEVPIVSLFTRDNSKSANKSHKQTNIQETATAISAPSSDEKRFSKDVMQNYLKKKVRPLYIRVSKRYADKLSSDSGPKQPPPSTAVTAQNSSPTTVIAEKKQPETEITAAVSNVKSLKQAGLRVVCKHLGKSRSASSAVAAAPSSSSRRRDDSLLQQQDGIQSAILHCKRSFNASRDCDSSLLSRSVSDPSHELSRKSSGEAKVSRIQSV
ncbi:probable membrane-associated kinase regulator 2 isoform X1 [Ricinus communis]|uniref:probable membrane-associated kinase regulator 2 isoform X1 n=1 Tax=Ricinus communis TaxID=3988 RepID=UPI00077224FF|nr:probable membrane-associated kinase regulator 2 isoform X1 [Ricinus communis]|eukprot:XP_015570521.1 probable membrane-associated kinase regulator 2 isoform X1 [Ricinus communis]